MPVSVMNVGGVGMIVFQPLVAVRVTV